MDKHAHSFGLSGFILAAVASLAIAASGCGNKEQGEKATGTGGGSKDKVAVKARTSFDARTKKLLAGVPAEAFAVGFVDSPTDLWDYVLKGFIYELDPENRDALDKELRAFVTERLGLDVSKASSAVVFGMGAGVEGAALVSAVGGEMKAPAAGTYGDVSLYALDSEQKVLAAVREDTLVVGSAEGVRAALDTLSGKRPNLEKAQPELWAWIQKECGGAFIGAATGDLGAAPPQLQGMAAQTGIERACVRLDVNGIRGVLAGDQEKLAASAKFLESGLAQQLAVADAMRSKGTSPGSSAIEGITAILGYHYMKSLFDGLKPELKDGRLEIGLPLELGDTGFIVFFVGVSSAVAIPAFMKYIKKSKTAEARELIYKMYQGARAYYMDPGMSAGGLQAAAPQFPEPSAGPTPPLGACCQAGGKCAPRASLWETAPWNALMFSVDDPHYYSYQYVVVDKQRQFVVRAFGDLDCDGEFSTFEMTGTVDPATGDVGGSPSLVRTDELE